MGHLTKEPPALWKGSSHFPWPKPPALLWSIKSRVSVPFIWLKCVLRNRGSPSPSSLMDFGSDTAKHCIVSYFCCASWSCVSSASLWGFTSMRQLKVWLFRRGFSLDHGTPFTVGGRRRDITHCHSFKPAFPNFSLNWIKGYSHWRWFTAARDWKSLIFNESWRCEATWETVGKETKN